MGRLLVNHVGVLRGPSSQHWLEAKDLFCHSIGHLLQLSGQVYGLDSVVIHCNTPQNLKETISRCKHKQSDKVHDYRIVLISVYKSPRLGLSKSQFSHSFTILYSVLRLTFILQPWIQLGGPRIRRQRTSLFSFLSGFHHEAPQRHLQERGYSSSTNPADTPSHREDVSQIPSQQSSAKHLQEILC